MTGVLTESGNVDTDTHREMPCEGGSRDGGKMSTSQGTPKRVSPYLELEQNPSHRLRGKPHCQPLDFGCLAPF